MPESRVVFVTGCSSGFGRLTAELLATEGYRVFATMRDSATRNAVAAADLDGTPGIRVLDMDVTSEASVAAAVASALDDAGHIDSVVNNAGLANFGLTEAFTPDQWKQLFDINLFGCVRVNRAVLPSMRRR